MSHQGELLKKLVRRKKLTQAQASDALGFSRDKLNRLYNKPQLPDEVLEEVQKVFDTPASYFGTAPITAAQIAQSPPSDASCWQLLLEAQRTIISLQQQIIEMSKPNINAPVGVK